MKYLYTVFLIMNLLFVSAQIIKTDLGIYPPPPPPELPSAGGKIIDPTFGTAILRVTDEADGKDNEHGYSYWPCFNIDNSIVYVYRVHGVAKIYDMDTSAFTISNKRDAFQTLIDGGYPLGEDQIWSHTDKNILYCHTYKKLVAYDVTHQTYTVIKDFTGEIAGNEYLNQMSCDAGATKFSFSRKKKSNYEVVGYMVWDARTDSIYSVDDKTVDEVQLDKTGQWLWVKTTLQGAGKIQSYVTNLSDFSSEGLTDNAPDYAPGHGDVGPGFITGYENWENRILYRTCSDPHTFKEVWNFGNDWGQDLHLSMLSADNAWVLTSCYLTDKSLFHSGLFENEIFQITTDGSMQVRRLCHHQSNYKLSGNNYWASPRASISYDGKFIMFTSNWGDKTRTDVFIVKIPSTSVLPLTWLNFTAGNTGKNVILNWQTANELNNSYFDVERSNTNNTNWNKLTRVNSKGNAAQPQSYAYTDNTPLKGTNFYRLKQVDPDGKFSYSKIISIDFAPSQIKLYPNPAKNILIVRGLNPSGITTLSIVDASGRQVRQLNTIGESYTFNLQKLSSGNYYLKAEADKKLIILTFVKE